MDGLGLGPMVSAGVPVYDRMYSPPIFRGVVTIDMRSCDMCAPAHDRTIAGIACGTLGHRFRILADYTYCWHPEDL